jgi:hypothetical protein
MSVSEDFLSLDDLHPIDIVEDLAAHHDWEFDRVTDDQIAMAVEGQWRTYSLTLAWSAQDETLRLICTFEMEPPEDRLPAVYDILNRCNDMVWTGAFTYWAEQKLMVWRYGLLLSGGHVAGAEQIDTLIANLNALAPSINAIAGERCSPHPHNFTDRLIRPGDQAYFDIIQSYMGYRTCYYRTFTVGSATRAQQDAYKRARNWMDGAIAMLKPGVTTDKVAAAFPKCTEIGFETEMSAFGLNFCHGLGLGLHERPLISRLNSFKDPYELKAGMVFAVETFCPAKDGVSAARIEEEVVLTPNGAQVISLFPAQELPIANKY